MLLPRPRLPVAPRLTGDTAKVLAVSMTWTAKTLAAVCQKTGWPVHAYSLRRNHFHTVLETPNANLVAGRRWFLSAYTIRLNHRQKLFGPVFSGRYQARLVAGSGNGYLRLGVDSTAARVRMGSAKGAKSVLPRWVHSQDKTSVVPPKNGS